MKAKKLWWFVVFSYADDDVDVVRTDDYEKAVRLAEKAWQGELSEWSPGSEQGLLSVELVDAAGRVCWDSSAEPRGLPRLPSFSRITTLASGKGTGPALGPV